MKKHEWKRIKWPFNSAEPYASWECWQYRQVILRPSQFHDDEWSYVASFGADSELSGSGGFSPGTTFDMAKAEIEERYARNGW